VQETLSEQSSLPQLQVVDLNHFMGMIFDQFFLKHPEHQR
jgi:hypothetical protein